MNQFNSKLDHAKSRQKRLYLATGIIALAVLLLVATLFVFSRGTRIEIMPEVARKLAETKVTEGIGFNVKGTIYSLTKNPVITVSATGFRDAKETIGSAHLGKVFPIELIELPGRLVIEITNVEDNDLTKTKWRVDGRDVAISNKLEIEQEAGSYTVTADNQFYQIKKIGVEIKRGEQTQLKTELQPVEGVLNISSKPSGATVFINEKGVGLTPLQLPKNGGRYNLRIGIDNHIDTLDKLEVIRTKPKVSRNYLLDLKKATATFNLTPKGGTLLVDGNLVKGTLTLDAMVEHHLTYMKDGFYPKTKKLKLKADEEKEITFNLNPEIGEVQITSSPSATVWIDNKKYEFTPVSINLPAVVHEISFKKPGYRTVMKSVKPKADTIQKVSAKLLTEYQARLQEAPREFTNQAGIKLKLFIVDDGITMGAPRSQKGQRANEFQRKIHLTKPFYVSIHEITNKQFANFNPQKATGIADTPVTSVSWQEAVVFCNWLSAKEKLQPFYKIQGGKVVGFNTSTDGYRLLSEAEWEWLARKSGKTKQTIFGWGNETIIPPKTANVADESAKGQVKFFVPHYDDGYSGIAPVGSLNREMSGLYDLSGNVSEWVHDIYSIVPPKTSAPSVNPFGPQNGQTHVVKGANWRSGTITTLRPAFRQGLAGGRDDVGFRIARYLYGGENE